MKFSIAKKGSRSILNITPLIDVLFILIIFFAVSSTFLEQSGIKLELPEAKKADVQRIEKAVLFISPEEKITLNNKAIDLANLGPMLKDAIDKSEEKTLIIRADKRVNYGFVVKVMDIARQYGVQKLVVATEEK